MEQKNKTENVAAFLDLFPILRDAGTAVRTDFNRIAKINTIPARKILYSAGDECKYFGLVVSGTIRVFCYTPSGGEITYYRVKSGECCVLTASCLMNGTAFPAVAMAEDDVCAVIIPSSIIRE